MCYLSCYTTLCLFSIYIKIGQKISINIKIFLGGNLVGGIFLLAIYPGGNYSCENCLGGNFPGGNSPGWELLDW